VSSGIAVVHQEPRLFPDLSVAENVFMGHPPHGALGSIDWRGMRRQAAEIFRGLDVRMDTSAIVRGLSMADQQLIEIAKALSLDARVLILDEPTASLSAHEVERLFTIVRQTRDRGVAVLFVSHRLDEVFELCDVATVFRDGRHVVTAPTSSLTTADLVRYMVGRAVTLFPKVESPVGDVLLEVEGLGRGEAFRDVSFTVRAGEIVGMAGLVGAGRTEIARVLFGVDKADTGQVRLSGEPVTFHSASDALRAGIAYVPEDRHQDGLVLDFSIAENVTLPILPRLFPRLFTHAAVERKIADRYAAEFSVRSTGVDQEVSALSGGNQQKVVLAKWLATDPRVLILDEPTRGIDIGAKVEVHRLIAELAAGGLGIILISSDLPEVLAMSDRILVMHEGRISAEIQRADATEETVMFAATGQDAEPGAGRGGDRRPPERPMAEAAIPGRRPDGLVVGRPAAPGRRPPARAEPRRRDGGARRVRVHPGAAAAVRVEPDPGHRPRLDHRGRGRRRGDRHPDPQRRPVDRGDDRPRRVRRRRHPRDEDRRAPGRDPARRRPRPGPGPHERRAGRGPPGAGDHRDARDAVGLSRLHAAARRRQADHADPAAAGYTDWARGTVVFLPLFVVIALVVVTVAAIVLRQTTIGRQVYALGSNPEAAEILGIRTRLITISTFAVCGLLAGVAGVMWGMEFGTINATAATGVTLQVIAAVVVGGVNINGGSGTVVGAGIGALFLAFIQNALILLKLSQFWLQAIYGLVILIAVVIDGALLRAVQRSRARGRRP
jgi:rhamnose transport system ATP-binding protein